MSRFSLNKLIPGALVIIGDDGLRRFNSDDGLFHVVNNGISGAFAIPTIIIPDGKGINATDVWTIGSCQSGCTDIIGSVKITGYGGVIVSGPGGIDSSATIFNNVWITMMGGSCLVIYQDGHVFIGSSPDPNQGLNQMIYYYFQIAGTAVQLVRRAWVSSSSQGSMTINSHTLSYKLKAGRYT